MILIFIFYFLVQSSLGFDLNNIERQDVSNNIFGIPPHSGTPESTIQYGKVCDKAADLHKILWEIIPMLRQNTLTNYQYTQLLHKLKGVINTNYGDDNEMVHKIDGLLRTMDDKQFDLSNTEMLRDGPFQEGRQENKMLSLKYELPKLRNPFCADALLAVIRIAYQTYLSLLNNPTCYYSGKPGLPAQISDNLNAMISGNPSVEALFQKVPLPIIDGKVQEIYHSILNPKNNILNPKTKISPGIYDNLIAAPSVPFNPSNSYPNNYPNDIIPMKNYEIPKNIISYYLQNPLYNGQNSGLNLIYPQSAGDKSIPIISNPAVPITIPYDEMHLYDSFKPEFDSANTNSPPFQWINGSPRDTFPLVTNPHPIYTNINNMNHNPNLQELSLPENFLDTKTSAYFEVSTGPQPSPNGEVNITQPHLSQPVGIPFSYYQLPLDGSYYINTQTPLITNHGALENVIANNIHAESELGQNIFPFESVMQNTDHLVPNHPHSNSPLIPNWSHFDHQTNVQSTIPDISNINLPQIVPHKQNQDMVVNDLKLIPNKRNPITSPIYFPNVFPIQSNDDQEIKISSPPLSSSIISKQLSPLPINWLPNADSNLSIKPKFVIPSNMLEHSNGPSNSQNIFPPPPLVPDNAALENGISNNINSDEADLRPNIFPFDSIMQNTDNFVPYHHHSHPSLNYPNVFPINDKINDNQEIKVSSPPLSSSIISKKLSPSPFNWLPNADSNLSITPKFVIPSNMLEHSNGPSNSQNIFPPPPLVPDNAALENGISNNINSEADLKPNIFPFDSIMQNTDNFVPYHPHSHPSLNYPNVLSINDKINDNHEIKISSPPLSSSIISKQLSPLPFNWLPNADSSLSITPKFVIPSNKLEDSNGPSNFQNIIPPRDMHYFPSTSNYITTHNDQLSQLLPKFRIIAFIRSAIRYIEMIISIEKFDPPTLTAITKIKYILGHSDEDIQNEEYIAILKLYEEIISYIKTLSGYEELIDRMDLSRVMNRYKLENQKNIELTYLVKQPLPVVYYPRYYVKYTVPYQTFVVGMQKILREKSHLRMNPKQVYDKLLVGSKVAETSPDLKNYNKEDLVKLTFKSGSLVHAKLVDANENLVQESNVFRENHSDVKRDEILEQGYEFANQMRSLASNPHIIYQDHKPNTVREITSTSEAPHSGKLEEAKPQFNSSTSYLMKSSKSNFEKNDENVLNLNPTTEAKLDVRSFQSNKLRSDSSSGEHSKSAYPDYVLSINKNSSNNIKVPVYKISHEVTPDASVLHRLYQASLEASNLRERNQIDSRNLDSIKTDDENVSFNSLHPINFKTSSFATSSEGVTGEPSTDHGDSVNLGNTNEAANNNQGAGYEYVRYYNSASLKDYQKLLNENDKPNAHDLNHLVMKARNFQSGAINRGPNGNIMVTSDTDEAKIPVNVNNEIIFKQNHLGNFGVQRVINQSGLTPQNHNLVENVMGHQYNKNIVNRGHMGFVSRPENDMIHGLPMYKP